jgi:hypothetical protein
MDMNHCSMMGKCEMSQCMTMTKEECAAHCDSVGCSAEEKEMCMSMYGADGKFDMKKCKEMCKSKMTEACEGGHDMKGKKACCAEEEEEKK